MTEKAPRLLVHFDRIVVNVMETNTGIFVGTNVQSGWNSHNKTNASLTGITGDGNEISGNVNVILDNDGIDTAVDDRDVLVDSRKMVPAS